METETETERAGEAEDPILFLQTYAASDSVTERSVAEESGEESLSH